jgi:hypothetical protein
MKSVKNLFLKIENKFLRVAAIIAVIIVAIMIVTIIFISPIAKYTIEHNSEKWIGRKVEMSWLYINPFTGAIHAHNLVLYENKSKMQFFSIGDFSASIVERDLLSKTISIRSVTLNHLSANIIQNKKHFNFDDLIKKKSTPGNKTSGPLHFYVKDIEVENSRIDYYETSIGVHYFISQLKITSPSISWNQDVSHFQIGFNSLQNSGQINADLSMNLKTLGYNINTLVSHLDLKPVEQYAKEFANYGTLSAYLNADMKVIGNLKNSTEFTSSGKLSIDDFHYGKAKGDDYLSFAKFSLNIDTLSPVNKKYFFNSVTLDSPYIKYERYDSLDNFSRIFGIKGANVKQAKVAQADNIIFLIADLISNIAKEIINSQYRADEFKITNVKLVYNDYSLLEKFSVTTNPLLITIKNIDTRNQRMFLNLQSQIYPYGNILINFDVNPNNFGDFNLKYSLTNFPIPLFNPYLITYTSHPFDKGTMELNGQWNVVNKQIVSDNHVLFDDPTTTDKIKNAGAKNIPVPLILAFVRDINRQIDVSLPITGNLSDPSYHLGSAILQVIENIFVKPPTFPVRAVIQSKEQEKEDLIMMEWKLTQSKMEDEQKDQLRKISFYLFFHPKAQVIITPYYYEEREKEMIVLYLAKRKYYEALNKKSDSQITEDDSVQISKMSIKDKSFIKYLDRVTNAANIDFTTQGKCLRLVGQGNVDLFYNKLIDERKNEILNYFSKVKDRVTFLKGTDGVPATGFSNYIFNYKGEKPEAISKSP